MLVTLSPTSHKRWAPCVGLNFKDMDILFIKIIRPVGHNPPASEQLLM